MNYERITLEMLERIKTLEEKVGKLEQQGFDLEEDEDSEVGEEPIHESKGSGRRLSRSEIMEILSEKYKFSVRKGNRSEGSGIVASKAGKSYNIKVTYSRSYFDYVQEEVICSGWHTLYKKEIENEDFSVFIFVVADAENNFHYFIFKREDIIKEFNYKVYDASGRIHFYFRVKSNGRPVELREIEKDMSKFYNNWELFSKL